MNHQPPWQSDQTVRVPASQELHPSNHTMMGTMRNRHGDEVVALDTPQNRIAVELRSGVCGSGRHAVFSLSHSLTSPSGSHREDSQRSLPDVPHGGPFNAGDFFNPNSSPKSGQLTTSQVHGSGPSASEDGSPHNPVRLLVCILNESSESMLVPSFMHLQVSVMVQFAVGVGKVQEALIENEKAVALTLSDCGHQLVFFEAALVAENPKIVRRARQLTPAPLILMLGTDEQCERWGLDVAVPPSALHGVLFDVGSMESAIWTSLDARNYFAEQAGATSLRRKEFNLQVTPPLSSPPGSPTFLEEQHISDARSASRRRSLAQRKIQACNRRPNAGVGCSSSNESGEEKWPALRFDAAGTVAGTRPVSKQTARMLLAAHPILFPSPP